MKATPYMYRHGGHECAVVHLASINVKSEDSILLKKTVTRSQQCILKEICRALRVVRYISYRPFESCDQELFMFLRWCQFLIC